MYLWIEEEDYYEVSIKNIKLTKDSLKVTWVYKFKPEEEEHAKPRREDKNRTTRTD
jgi:hypothetical protein